MHLVKAVMVKMMMTLLRSKHFHETLTNGNINVRLRTAEAWIARSQSRMPIKRTQSHPVNNNKKHRLSTTTILNACSICHKHFSTPATLKRHRDALHAQQRTKFQCWSCEKIYARKENVLRHTRKTHGDTDRKFIITTLTNKHYKPEIFKRKT